VLLRAGEMRSKSLHDARIAVVDDEAANVELLHRILDMEGYTDVSGHTDPREFLENCRILPPDLVLLDLMMPEVDGFEVLQRLRTGLEDFDYRPVMIITSDDDRDTKQRALSDGARDFLAKPVSPVELRLRVKNLLHTRFLQLELQRHAEHLEERVRSRTSELEEARLEILDRLAVAAEYRDDATGEHTRRVGRECAALAAALGLPSDQVEDIRRAAPLHDVGKIALPDTILLKRGSLSGEEIAIMREHTTVGASILSGSRFPMMRTAEEIALHHHECWDGSGYPDGLSGEQIPLAARIVAIIDVFDSLTHARVYKRAWTTEEALDEVESLSGTKFDPTVAEAFLRMHGRMPAGGASDDSRLDEEGRE
jgi:putative two-component system response regulator